MNIVVSKPLLEQDLSHVLNVVGDSWIKLKNARILLTGASGFFGSWLLETWHQADQTHSLESSLYALTRNKKAFFLKYPHFQTYQNLTVIEGDIRDFHFPEGDFSHVLHTATEASVKLNLEDPSFMFDVIVTGMKRVLQFCTERHVHQMLFTSSGAIYGDQDPESYGVEETCTNAPDISQTKAAYGEGKRCAEFLGLLHSKEGLTQVKLARCFAFMGPRLPLESHFAIGNFIGQILKREPIVIQGDGTPYRSYLYAADLTIWLWCLLLKAEAGRPYNVGSDIALSIKETAGLVNEVAGHPFEIEIKKSPVPGVTPSRYVPSVTRAEKELGLEIKIGLTEGIKRTLKWHEWSTES